MEILEKGAEQGPNVGVLLLSNSVSQVCVRNFANPWGGESIVSSENGDSSPQCLYSN